MSFQTLGLTLPEKRNNSLENPSIPLSSPLAWHILTGGGCESDAGEMVNPATSMGQASVNACVRLISETISSMSPILYERIGTGKVEATAHPLHNLLTLEPNPDSTAFSMWDSFVASIALTGNGYIEIQRDGVGTIQGLYFLPPSTVTPMRQPDGSLAYRVTWGMSGGQFRLLPAKSVIHVPWHSVDGITGISVIAQARNVIGTALAMDRSGGRFFANNSTPAGILSTTARVKPEDMAKMKADWEALHSGSNQHRIGVLDQDLKFQQIGIPNADSQWIESQKLSRESICGLFKILPSQIGDAARVAGETYAAQQMSFLTHCIRPWLNRISQELTRKLIPGLPKYFIAHDVSDLLKLDFKTMMDGFAIARQWGIVTSNEARAQLDLDPGPAECNLFWAPQNIFDAKRLLDPPTPTTVTGVESV